MTHPGRLLPIFPLRNPGNGSGGCSSQSCWESPSRILCVLADQARSSCRAWPASWRLTRSRRCISERATSTSRRSSSAVLELCLALIAALVVNARWSERQACDEWYRRRDCRIATAASATTSHLVGRWMAPVSSSASSDGSGFSSQKRHQLGHRARAVSTLCSVKHPAEHAGLIPIYLAEFAELKPNDVSDSGKGGLLPVQWTNLPTEDD